jgi:phosphate starvation-inducible protein PhoH and related proteins
MKEVILLENNAEASALFGKHDEYLKLIEKETGVNVASRGDKLTITGQEKNVSAALKIFNQLLSVIRNKKDLDRKQVEYAARAVKRDPSVKLDKVLLEKIEVCSKKAPVVPRTEGQKEYLDAIRENDIVFSIGPAGTGKTYLAMAMAVNSLMRRESSRIILTRPAVEAGEKLGYLPGDLYEKVSPYLRPLYDALYDMMEADKIKTFMDRGIIEVAPLAFMRGRTLNDSFIILDEAQNCTPEQMKMFLTRLGFDSKAVITGDITQSDLPGGHPIGVLQVQEILSDIKGIKFVYLTGRDVVRHELVQEIIKAYEGLKSRKEKENEES